MALLPFRRQPVAQPVTKPIEKPKSLLAAAVNISGNGGMAAWKGRASEDQWQREAWRQYDICGELRYAMNWIGNAVSMADLYAAEVDPDTGLVSGPTENEAAQTIAASVFGGAEKRPQAQSTIALNWQVAGEVFLLIRPRRGGGDEWLILSSTEVQERGGDFRYSDPVSGSLIDLDPRRDMLIRIWSPHPRSQSHADSAVRAALPTLREIEKTSMNIAARLDSRLSGAGIWIVPQEIDFAGNDTETEGPQGLMDSLRRAAEASLSNPGDASSQVPIIMQVPGEQVANFNYQTFATELTNEVLELRQAAIRRLALALDMPSEVMLGMGESNHWSAWQIEEATYKIHVAPLLDRIGSAITEQYFRPALVAAGVPNPDNYIIAFDTTEITTRPNRLEELTSLWDRRLISDDALRVEAGVPDRDMPTDDERDRRFLETLVERDTTLLADPGIRELLGLEELNTTSLPEDGNTSQPGIQEARQPSQLPARPQQAEESNAPDEGLVAAAELMVWDALSRAGGRLLTREFRGAMRDVPKHELHTRIDGSQKTPALLEGSFQFVVPVADTFGVDAIGLENRLREYTKVKIVAQEPHNREELRKWLSR